MDNELSKIHPDLQQGAKYSPRLKFNKRTVWMMNLLLALTPAPKAPGDVLVENILIPRPDSSTKIRLRVYKPKTMTAPAPVVYWVHGGGYLIGNPEMDDASCIGYVRELGLVVVSVEYRLAPSHPFPAGLDDCYSGLKWVASQSQQLGVDLNRLAIGGDSAGGGLAAALVQLAHDRGEIKAVFQLLVYPMLDDRTALRSDIDDSYNAAWSQKSNRFGWESYLGMKLGVGEVPAYAVPARRAALAGLPPAWIGVGTLDVFYEEDAAYAQRLKESGVDCELVIVEGAFHGFDRFGDNLPVVHNFQQSQIAALKKYLLP